MKTILKNYLTGTCRTMTRRITKRFSGLVVVPFVCAWFSNGRIVFITTN